jgi:large subunit ribosomal protein L21
MKSAIISLSGKQFNIKEGLVFKTDSIQNLDNVHVLAYSEGDSLEFGAPFLDKVKVSLSKVEDRLDDKLRIARFRAKSRYRKSKSHRQPISILKVESIELVSKKDN